MMQPRNIMWSIVTATLFTAPILMGGHTLNLAIEASCLAIAAAVVNLLVRYAGLNPLIHIAFWGLGAYSITLLTKLGVALPITLLTTVIVTAIYSALTIPLVIRAGGISGLLITLAFAQILASVSFNVIDSTDGAALAPRLSDLSLYVITVSLLALTLIFLQLFIRTSFGRVLEAIRQNSIRARALGYPILTYRIWLIVITSPLIGLAGALATYHQGAPINDQVLWLEAGVLLVIAIIGGSRPLWGPIIGAILYTALHAFLPYLEKLTLDYGFYSTFEHGFVGLLLIWLSFSPRSNLWSPSNRGRCT